MKGGETHDPILRQLDQERRTLSRGGEIEILPHSHDRPTDLLDRLRRQAFDIGPPEAVMVLDLQDPPPSLTSPSPHAVVRVDRIEQVDLFRRAAEAIFAKDYSFTSGELADAIRAGSEEHRGYMAISHGVAVSIGRLYTHRNSTFGGLYGGGTLNSHRGRGFYRAVIAARACDAIRLGARYLIADALPTSQRILTRLGFEHAADTWPCVWKPPKPGLAQG